jgi:ABC-type transport system involved in cytochrome bd biosynthesis fused ATPase/permease subunit
MKFTWNKRGIYYCSNQVTIMLYSRFDLPQGGLCGICGVLDSGNLLVVSGIILQLLAAAAAVSAAAVSAAAVSAAAAVSGIFHLNGTPHA